MTVLTGDRMTVETFEQFRHHFDVSKSEIVEALENALDTEQKDALLESISDNFDGFDDEPPEEFEAVSETTLATSYWEYLGTREAIDLILERRDRTYVFLPGQLAHDIVEIAY